MKKKIEETQEELVRLNKLIQVKDNKEFTKFFEAYNELNRETKEYHGAKDDSEFRTILEKTQGQKK